MTRKEIENLNNEIITVELLEEINLHEEVAEVVDLGRSTSHVGCEWFSIEFIDGSDVDVFVRG